MHTSQLELRIQGLPLPDHHQLTRHVPYVCVGVVDGIQHRIPHCEEDSLEALGESIATATDGHLTSLNHPSCKLVREGTQRQDPCADVNVTLRVALERIVVEADDDSYVICMFAGKEGEHHAECRKLQ